MGVGGGGERREREGRRGPEGELCVEGWTKHLSVTTRADWKWRPPGHSHPNVGWGHQKSICLPTPSLFPLPALSAVLQSCSALQLTAQQTQQTNSRGKYNLTWFHNSKQWQYYLTTSCASGALSQQNHLRWGWGLGGGKGGGGPGFLSFTSFFALQFQPPQLRTCRQSAASQFTWCQSQWWPRSHNTTCRARVIPTVCSCSKVYNNDFTIPWAVYHSVHAARAEPSHILWLISNMSCIKDQEQ